MLDYVLVIGTPDFPTPKSLSQLTFRPWWASPLLLSSEARKCPQYLEVHLEVQGGQEVATGSNW